jgi:aminoglycoside phosphotransferase (APT) family kinase protein
VTDSTPIALEATSVDWIEQQTNARVISAQRHVARREAYRVAWRSSGGETGEGFYRLDRQPVAGARVSLEREARICQALQATDVPVPTVRAWDASGHRALFELVPGRSDIDKLENARDQRAVFEDFIDAIARLHCLAPAALGLEDVLGSHALSASQCALDDLEGQLQQVGSFLDHYRDPLLVYGVQWLRRFAPERVARVSLVQGDTGPVNFLFQDRQVTAIVDWEWGHWGDPMEDLGNICVREFWNPSGGLDGLFHRYTSQSGIPYDANAVRYYRVQQNVRGMIPIHAVCQTRGMRESMAWYLAYREIGDRATTEALAEAMNIPIERPPLPEFEPTKDPLADAALTALRRDIAPTLDDAFVRSRADDAVILVECMDRLRRFEAEFEAIEASEIAALLGRPSAGVAADTEALCAAIEAGTLADEAIIPYLARRAYRREWLYWPVTRLYPDRQWSAIDT